MAKERTEFQDFVVSQYGEKAIRGRNNTSALGDPRLAKKFPQLYERFQKGERASQIQTQTKVQRKAQQLHIKKQQADALSEIRSISGGQRYYDTYKKGSESYIHYYYRHFFNDSSIDKIDFGKLIKIIQTIQVQKIVDRTKKSFAGDNYASFSLTNDDDSVKDAAQLFAEAYNIDEGKIKKLLDGMAEQINRNDVFTGGSQRSWGDSFSAGRYWTLDKAKTWEILANAADLSADALNIFSDTLDELHQNIEECFSTLCDLSFLDQIITYFRNTLSKDKDVVNLFEAINTKKSKYLNLDLSKGMDSKGISSYIRYNINTKIKKFLETNEIVDFKDEHFRQAWNSIQAELTKILEKYLRLTTALDSIEEYADKVHNILSSDKNRPFGPQLDSSNYLNDSKYIYDNFGYFSRCIGVLSGMMSNVGGKILEAAVADKTIAMFNAFVKDEEKMLSQVTGFLTGSGVANCWDIVAHVDKNLREIEQHKFFVYNKSNPKSDIFFAVTSGGIIFNFGVTVKAIASLKDVNILDGKFRTNREVSIKAQSGTPLTDLIYETLKNANGMTRKEALQSTYNEIATQYQSDSNLDMGEYVNMSPEPLYQNFSNFKSAIMRYNFADALAGSGKNLVESPIFLNINGLYFPLWNIIKQIMELGDESFFKKVNMFFSGGIVGDFKTVERHSFSSANEISAKKTREPSKEEGAVRSFAFYKYIEATKVVTTINLKDYVTK